MAFKGAYARTSLQIPKPDSIIPTPRDCTPTILADTHAIDPGTVAFKCAQAGTCFQIPEPDSRVKTPRDRAAPDRATLTSQGLAFLPSNVRRHLAGFQIPEPEVPYDSRAATPIGAFGHVPNPVRVSLECAQALTGF